MAASQGYGKAVTSGSVFAYDVADTINSFKGQPKTNLLTAISKAGVSDSTFFKTNSGTEIVNIPNIGNRTVHYVNIYNDYYGGSGNCCPSLMYFGDFSVSPSTVYTYQIIYKTTTGYAHPNYMYHYEFNGGTYVTEYGLWDSSRQESLGDGWAHAWGTFTSNASTNRFITYLFHYEYGVWNKIQVAGIMLTQGNNIIPPRQFLDINGTRSATQGLLPLAGNSSIDLSNVSFDSNAQLYFDGSNDYISLTPSMIPTNQITVEFVCKNNNPDGTYTSIIAGGVGDGNQDFNIHLPWGNVVYWDCGRPFNRISKTATSAERTGFHHWVFTKNPSTGVMNIYLDGNLWLTDTGLTSTLPSITACSLGRYDRGDLTGYYYNGNIPITKIYNRELTAGEVKQNYNKYKTRFNLS
jgi:hypothetical protein